MKQYYFFLTKYIKSEFKFDRGFLVIFQIYKFILIYN